MAAACWWWRAEISKTASGSSGVMRQGMECICKCVAFAEILGIWGFRMDRVSLRAGLLFGTAMVVGTLCIPMYSMAQAQTQTAPAPAPAQQAFDIPAQPLAAALDAFARHAGWQVGYPAVLAQGRTSGAVRGRMSPVDALAQLLAGTGLTYRTTGPNTVTLAELPAHSGGATTLPAVTVEGHAGAVTATTLPEEYPGGQVARGGRLGMLGNRDIMDTPFSTVSFTALKIEDQQAATMGEAVNSDPSVRMTGHAGGILEAFYIRGFPVNEGNVGDIAFDGVYGVAPTYRVMTDYAERIEVVKGATALLYGMAPNSAVGGGINIVPKRSTDSDLTRLTFDFAESTQLGSRVDVSRRYGEGREFGIRANGSYHDGDTQIDKQSRTATVGALALDYRGERFRATADMLKQQELFTAPSRPLFLNAGVAVPVAPDSRRNVTQSWEWSEISDQSGLLRAEYDLTERLTLFANLGGGHSRVDRLFGSPSITNASGDTSVTPSYGIFEADRITTDVGLRGKYETGPVGHTMALQVTRYHDVLERATVNAASAVTSNIYNPIAQPAQNVAAGSRVPRVSETELKGAALADTLAILDDRAQLTLGVRHQEVQSDNYSATTGATTSAYGKTATTPMVGLVVKPWQSVSLYASYIEGLSKGDIAPTTATNAGEAMAPYVARQHEVGVKIDHGRLATTLSLFEMTKPSGELVSSFYSVSGEQRNRGVELNVFGEVVPAVRVLGGVTLIDAELTKTRTASNIGHRPVGVPEMQANLGLEWDLPFVRGLTLGATAIYTGDQFVNAANTQLVPSWVRYDLGARYQTKLSETPVTVRLTVRNLLDDSYWSGVSSFGGLGQSDPRTVLLSTSFDF
jgi:iron complex outermembrane receptor protein